MHYRRYKPNDFEALYAIEELCFSPPLRFGRRYMQRLVNAIHATTWIAEDFEKMAGFAIAEWKPSLETISGYIQTIEVAPAFRGQGIGRALLERIEDSAREANAPMLWLHVDKTNDAAIGLYSRQGFLPVGEEANYYAPGRGALLYRKALNGSALLDD
jgi:[ribosomal protein S18]-alanine N-acetyltransferase